MLDRLLTTSTRRSFEIAYVGPALADGSIDGKDLAHAILSVGDIFQEANQVVNGDKATVGLRVNAHSHGSFEIGFEVVQGILSQLPFSSETIRDAAALQMLLFGAGGVFWWIKKHGNKESPSESTDELAHKGITERDESLEIDTPHVKLRRNIRIRSECHKLVRPVRKEGIDGLEVRQDKTMVGRVDEADLDNFEMPPSGTPVHEETRRDIFSIGRLSFREGNKWSLSDGSNTISVAIRDQEFIRQVDSNKVFFAKGDLLTCDLRITKYIVDGDLKTTYEVLRVVNHQSVTQYRLDLSDHTEDDDAPSNA